MSETGEKIFIVKGSRELVIFIMRSFNMSF